MLNVPYPYATAYPVSGYAAYGYSHPYTQGWPAVSGYGGYGYAWGGYQAPMQGYWQPQTGDAFLRAPNHPAQPVVTWKKPGGMEIVASMKPESKPITVRMYPKNDLWRDTPLRYLGYGNELVEGWEDVLNRFLGKFLGHVVYRLGYAISGVYLLLDTVDKGMKAYNRPQNEPEHVRLTNALVEAGGAGLFQYGASYKLPAEAVKYSRKGITALMNRIPTSHPLFLKNGLVRLFLPAILATAMIPVMAKPIDWVTHKALHYTYWRFINKLLDRPIEFRLISEHEKQRLLELERLRASGQLPPTFQIGAGGVGIQQWFDSIRRG